MSWRACGEVEALAGTTDDGLPANVTGQAAEEWREDSFQASESRP